MRFARAITNITAAPIPIELEILFDTPRKEQMPRNCESTTLLTKSEEIMIIIYSISKEY
jgi:hypothetical protein